VIHIWNLKQIWERRWLADVLSKFGIIRFMQLTPRKNLWRKFVKSSISRQRINFPILKFRMLVNFEPRGYYMFYQRSSSQLSIDSTNLKECTYSILLSLSWNIYTVNSLTPYTVSAMHGHNKITSGWAVLRHFPTTTTTTTMMMNIKHLHYFEANSFRTSSKSAKFCKRHNTRYRCMLFRSQCSSNDRCRSRCS